LSVFFPEREDKFVFLRERLTAIRSSSAQGLQNCSKPQVTCHEAIGRLAIAVISPALGAGCLFRGFKKREFSNLGQMEGSVATIDMTLTPYLASCTRVSLSRLGRCLGGYFAGERS
jgi:hypothetical protein